ncbi:MAG: DUF2470 domain-containing protein [Flavobacteriaceae bacterium]|nr:DUF2470 domain-containing protein [Flavobacteriaceae bacterium]
MAQKSFDSKFARYAVDHVNADHADAMMIICKAHKNQDYKSVTLLDYDIEKMQIHAVDCSNAIQNIDIPFVRPLENARDFRPMLIEILNTAKETLK